MPKPRAAALAALLLLVAPNAFALSTMPNTGTCGFIGSLQYPFAYMFGLNPGTGFGMNVMATLNFDTKAIAGNIVTMNPAAALTTQQQSTFSGTFTVTNGTLTGSSVVSASVTIAGSPATTNFFTWNVLPVNGGNTLLMQLAPAPAGQASGAMAGVCQF
jgi:hypothetical protein